jgi:hypothetical protein
MFDFVLKTGCDRRKGRRRQEATRVLNHDYEAWVAKDQQVLNYQLSSLTHDILSQLVTTAETVVAMWAAIRGMFVSYDVDTAPP